MGGHHHHHPTSAEAASDLNAGGEQRYRLAKRVTLIGSVVDFTLGVLKVVFGYLANSQALIADGIHSFSDLVTDAMVLVAAKHGSKDADEEHPYGHGRFETIATVALGVGLILVALGIAWDAIDRLFNPEDLLEPGIWALAVAFASIVFKEWIFHYTMRVARLLRSKLLEANAWHSRSDAISSIVVFVGVGGAMLGLEYLDAVAAVLVALMVAKIGWELAWNSVQELADAALEAERVNDIKEAIEDIEGVRAVHMLRSRRMGQDALIDVHVLVSPHLSVSEGHMIALVVELRLKKRFDEVTDVTVHIDPEDDEEAPPCNGLPLRSDALAQLQAAWPDRVLNSEQVVLHYLAGHVNVDLYLPLAEGGDAPHAAALRERLQNALEPMNDFGRLRVFFS